MKYLMNLFHVICHITHCNSYRNLTKTYKLIFRHGIIRINVYHYHKMVNFECAAKFPSESAFTNPTSLNKSNNKGCAQNM